MSGNPGSEPAPKPTDDDETPQDLAGDSTEPATEEQADTVSGGAPEPTGDGS